ncbi:hypothetical protein JQU24_11945 [Ponticoccus sp. SC6-38]|nr:hypothetical protein [Ponticoccus sp. SC6-38]MBM1278372.1 hypothetical protein [Ponticoccus sp. SC6-36]
MSPPGALFAPVVLASNVRPVTFAAVARVGTAASLVIGRCGTSGMPVSIDVPGSVPAPDWNS